MTVKVITGDSMEVLRDMPPCFRVNCIVTSPPYWGLRDYGNELQLGLEKTPEEYVENMVYLFRLAREKLADDGTLWLNLGDSYASGGMSNPSSKSTLGGGKDRGAADYSITRSVPDGLKSKDLVGIPWRVALALQADGWYLRSDIIWHKPSCMPESVKDRPTRNHEYIFLLSKNERYYYDQDAISEPASETSGWAKQRAAGIDTWQYNETPERIAMTGQKRYTGKATKDYASAGAQDPSAVKARIVDKQISGELDKRNKRSVWTVTTKPYSGAHFATFPPDLIEPCILAGCPVGGTVLDPFGGAGTTGLVADRLQRNAVLIELNPQYADMARERIRKDAGMFAEVA